MAALSWAAGQRALVALQEIIDEWVPTLQTDLNAQGSTTHDGTEQYSNDNGLSSTLDVSGPMMSPPAMDPDMSRYLQSLGG